MTDRPIDGLGALAAVPDRARLVLVGATLLTFQAGVLRIALPVIRADLDTGVSGIQLVSLASLVVVTTTLVMFGRLADLVGAGRVYLAGLLGFAVGGVLAAMAPTTELLVAALALQGLGWSMCAGAGPPLLVIAVPDVMRGRALASYHVAVAIGLGVGPAGGGLLVDGLGWRVAVAASVVVALPLAVALHHHVRHQRPARGVRRRSFDVTGAVLLGTGLAGLLLLLYRGGPHDVLAGVLAVIGIAAFVGHESRADDPLLDLELFRRLAFSAGLAASFLTFVAMAANMFLMPFFLQDHRGYSPTVAGAIMAAVPVVIVVVAPLAGRVTDRRGPRLPATAGLALVTIGVGLMATLDRHVPVVGIVAVLAVYGAGAAFFQSPNTAAVLGAVDDGRVGVASGSLSTVGRLGQVAGIALAGTIWDAALSRPELQPASAVPFRVTFLALAAVAAFATAVSWLRGPVAAIEPEHPLDAVHGS